MPALKGDSPNVNTDAILGTNAVLNGTAAGVHGVSKNRGPGVYGESVDGRGVEGKSTNNYGIRAHSDNIAGLRASSTKSRGIEGNSIIDDGVAGSSTSGTGVVGTSQTGVGMRGEGITGVVGISQTGDGVSGFGRRGVLGKSIDFQGVQGHSTNNAGVVGISEKFVGVWGESKSGGRGVYGKSETGQAIFGESTDQAGVVGESKNFVGVWGESKSNVQPGVFGKGILAARFDGDVEISGIIRMTNADFAEDFDVREDCEPGEVVVLTDTGILELSRKEYDKKAVGIISGAGNYKPGIILDRQNRFENRKPVAMVGKVYCRVDADSSAIETGDLLTTSNFPGHAMKALDPFKAFGSVIGKALGSLASGKGLIPVLVFLK